MDLGDQTDWVKFMIRDRGSNCTDVFDVVLADAWRICTVLGNRVQAPGHGSLKRLDRATSARQSCTATSPCDQVHLLRRYCATTKPTTISTALTAP